MAFRVDLSSHKMLNSVNGNPVRSSIPQRPPSPTVTVNVNATAAAVTAPEAEEAVDGLTCKGDVCFPKRPGFFI